MKKLKTIRMPCLLVFMVLSNSNSAIANASVSDTVKDLPHNEINLCNEEVVPSDEVRKIESDNKRIIYSADNKEENIYSDSGLTIFPSDEIFIKEIEISESSIDEDNKSSNSKFGNAKQAKSNTEEKKLPDFINNLKKRFDRE